MIPVAMKDGLDDSSSDVSDGEELVLSLHDRVEHDGRSHVREDEKELQEGSEVDLVVLPATGDVAGGVVENRLEESQRRDGRDEGKEEQNSEDARDSLRVHLTPFRSKSGW